VNATTGSRRYLFLFAAICLGLLPGLSDADFGWVTDGQIMLDTAVSLREFGNLATNYGYDTEGFTAGAGRSGKYGLGYSLILQLPLALAAPVESVFGAGSSNVLFPFLNLLLTALTAATIAVALGDMGAAPVSFHLAAVAYAFGTYAWPYVSYDFSEPLQALCVVLAFRFAVAAGALAREGKNAGWRPAIVALSLGFGILTKATLLVLVPVFALHLAAVAGRRPGAARTLWRFGLTLAIALAGIVLLNQVRYGSWLDFGYGVEGKRFTTPVLTGLYGLLIGPNKGLLFYAPVTLLAPWGLRTLWRAGRRSEAFLLLGCFGALLSSVATWWSWEGGFSWGPRLLLPVLPLAVIAAASIPAALAARCAFVACGLAGVLVNLLGVLLNYTVWFGVAGLSTKRVPLSIEGRPPWEYTERDGIRYYLPAVAVSYVPSLSPIAGHAWLLRVRYLGEPFALDALPRAGAARLIDYPPLRLDLTPLTEGYVLARLRSPRLWLPDRLLGAEREALFAQPIYAAALTRLGDAAMAVGDRERALECHRRAQRFIALSEP